MSKKSNESHLILNLPRSLYIMFSLISLVLFLSIMMIGGSIISYAVFIISVIVLTYHEKWTFDKESKKIKYVFGLGFISKTFNYSFTDIEMIEKVIFKKGELKKEKESNVFSLKLHVKTGKDHTVLTYSKSKRDQFNVIVNEIESITGLKVQEI